MIRSSRRPVVFAPCAAAVGRSAPGLRVGGRHGWFRPCGLCGQRPRAASRAARGVSERRIAPHGRVESARARAGSRAWPGTRCPCCSGRPRRRRREELARRARQVARRGVGQRQVVARGRRVPDRRERRAAARERVGGVALEQRHVTEIVAARRPRRGSSASARSNAARASGAGPAHEAACPSVLRGAGGPRREVDSPVRVAEAECGSPQSRQTAPARRAAAASFGVELQGARRELVRVSSKTRRRRYSCATVRRCSGVSPCDRAASASARRRTVSTVRQTVGRFGSAVGRSALCRARAAIGRAPARRRGAQAARDRRESPAAACDRAAGRPRRTASVLPRQSSRFMRLSRRCMIQQEKHARHHRTI